MRKLYAAKARDDLQEVCQSFVHEAEVRIAGATPANPLGVIASGASEFRPLLALLIKAFRTTELGIISILIDDPEVAVYWPANVQSRITGATVPTELIDLVEVRGGQIVRFNEFFVSR
ncbi:MAG TPA: nuclear transport factor 2 family protein [Candidatus Binataceae bacterium]|nr:nuclear transport factor 2 family protein [Candidatus Binataceae bacterium]